MRLFLFLLPLSLSLSLNAQQGYRGIVVDSVSMVGMSGVYVSIKGSAKATVTNQSGLFTLSATPLDTLVFSYLGYVTLELPLFLEEDALFIRMRDQTRMLQEIVIKASRLYPNEILDRTRVAPRKMEGYQALQSPFTYFSKTEKEKRKIYRYVEESNKTQTYIQVITDPVVKEIFTKDYNLTDEEYYDLLASFNQQYRTIQYATSPEDIMEALHAYFGAVK
ncbi:MAG: carboxypeptidase-like regulatory domain-containing protein [Cyclobacteriaceae bacterium]|nr:carboxypeptidase-like regulatory domain-containing protein [Cyclobacteriaceae bacterium]